MIDIPLGITITYLGIFEIRIGVNSRIADATVQAIHNHGQFHCCDLDNVF